MPKKRRSEKIIAQLRRKLSAKEAKKETFKKESPTRTPLSSFIQPEPENEETPSSFVMSDLKKSLFLTTLAISLEFVLYYLLELGGG